MDRHLPADLRLQLNGELAALRELDGDASVAPDFLRCCAELAEFHAHARAAIRRARGAAAAARRAPEDAPTPRRLTADEIGLDLALLRKFLGELRALSRFRKADDDPLTRLADVAASSPEFVADLAAAAGDAEQAERVAVRVGLASPAVAYVGSLLAAPFLAEARHRRGEQPECDAREQPVERAGRCPTCDAVPVLAVLDAAEGYRHLLCALCGDRWLAPRVLCPSCGATAGLATLRCTLDEARWVETCEGCRRYLTTIDLRRLPERYLVRPIVELAASAHLDLIAEEAGYGRLASDAPLTNTL